MTVNHLTKKEHTAVSVLFTVIAAFFGIIHIGISVLNLFFSKELPLYARHLFLFPNLVLLLGFILFGSCLYFLTRHVGLPRGVETHQAIWKWSLFVALFVFQLVFTYNTYASVGWDPGMLFGSAQQIIEGRFENVEYFSQYPNNILTLKYIVLIKRLSLAVGIPAISDGCYTLLVINCVINSVTGILLYSLTKKLCGVKCALFGWFLYALLIGTSAHLDVYYTDSIAILFPVLIAYLWICMDTTWCFVLIGLLGAFSLFLKPQACIILIAVFLIEASKLLSSKFRTRESALRLLFMIAGSASGIIIGKLLSVNSLGLDPEKSMGLAHYFMMGLHDVGSYAGADVDFSASFATKAARNSADMQEAFRRIKEYDFSSFINHVVKKALFNYHDGCFGNFTADFFWLNERVCTNRLSAFLTNLIRGGGRAHPIFEAVKQATWLFVISLSSILPFRQHAFDQKAREKAAGLMLSLIGIFLFLMLFEANARYLYIYSPIFIITALTVFAKAQNTGEQYE